MKKIILLTIAISTTLLFGCSKTDNLLGTTNDVNTENTVTNVYENKDNNFQLNIPKGRTFKENVYGSVIMLFSPQTQGDTISENIGITVNSIISGENLESLYNQNKNMLTQTISGINIVDEQNLTINDKAAKSITYSLKEGNIQIKQTQYLVLSNEKYYIITYMALENTFKDFKDDLEKIIGSFKF